MKNLTVTVTAAVLILSAACGRQSDESQAVVQMVKSDAAVCHSNTLDLDPLIQAGMGNSGLGGLGGMALKIPGLRGMAEKAALKVATEKVSTLEVFVHNYTQDSAVPAGSYYTLDGTKTPFELPPQESEGKKVYFNQLKIEKAELKSLNLNDGKAEIRIGSIGSNDLYEVIRDDGVQLDLESLTMDATVVVSNKSDGTGLTADLCKVDLKGGVKIKNNSLCNNGFMIPICSLFGKDKVKKGFEKGLMEAVSKPENKAKLDALLTYEAVGAKMKGMMPGAGNGSAGNPSGGSNPLGDALGGQGGNGGLGSLKGLLGGLLGGGNPGGGDGNASGSGDDQDNNG